jgi:hypothetical protein
MMYYPEMGDKPAPRIFQSQYNYKSYSLFWKGSEDDKARSILKELRIRPLKCAPIEPRKVGEWSWATRAGEDGFSCLISFNAVSKLIDRDLCAHEVLLD